MDAIFGGMIYVIINMTNGAVIGTMPTNALPEWATKDGIAAVMIDESYSAGQDSNRPGYDGGWSMVPDDIKQALLAPAKAIVDAKVGNKAEADAAIQALLSGALTVEQERDLAVALLKRVLADKNLLKEFVEKK